MPNGRWLARITVGYRADGGLRTVTKTHDTEADAEAWIMAQSVEMGACATVHAGVTLGKAWTAYKASRLPMLASKTQANYRWHMEGVTSQRDRASSSRHVTWLDVMGDVDVSEITCAMVQQHLSTMAHEKAKHAKTVISAVLSWAARSGFLDKNPLVGHKFTYPERAEVDYDDDPFAAIEGVREVWDVGEVLRCFELIRGLPLEPAWLACVGAGLRVEEALALRGKDVRRVQIGERQVTQVAVYAARTDMDERKTTKTRQSVRIVTMMDPMGERYWELASKVARDKLVCPVSASNQNKRWRSYFAPPRVHKRMAESRMVSGRLQELRYIPLSKMRNTHVTLMQMAGVPDSLNALMHGHTEQVERRHYMRPDVAEASATAAARLQLVV